MRLHNDIFPRFAHRKAPRLTESVRNAIYDHVYDWDDREVGGVLVGYRRADGGSARVTGAIRAPQASEARTSVTFTHETWQAIHRELDRREDQTIVGWYHSHPGLGVFLSDQDRFIHRHFFSDPTQVAFVVDPGLDRERWFGWQGGEISPLTREMVTARVHRDAGFRADDSARDPGLKTQAWLERAGYIFMGIVVGVVLWALVLRNDTAHTTGSSSRQTRTVTRAQPQAVEPKVGAQPNLGDSGQTSTGSGP